MSKIFLATGNATMGNTTRDKDGNVIESTPAKFEFADDGPCVAVGLLDPETSMPQGVDGLFGDWDAAGYLVKALELLNPRRQINIPDFKAIIKAAIETDNIDFCDYCPRMGYDCRDCAVTEWKGEIEE